MRPRLLVTACVAAALVPTGCAQETRSAPGDANANANPSATATATATAGAQQVTVTNCGEEVTFPTPAQRLFVSDGNQIATVLELEAKDQVIAVSRLTRDRKVLTDSYGEVVAQLNEVSDKYPSRETVLAQRPDVMVAGWTAGYNDTTGLTPERLRADGIAAYILTESCRTEDGRRGIVDPWEAVRIDLTNLGRILGREDRAAAAVADLNRRLDALRSAPMPSERPNIFIFDGGTTAPFTSGRFGGPEGIVAAAGGRNVFTDVEDTWFEASWESVVHAEPDAIAIVDYPGQSLEEKIALLRERPGLRDLSAVRENRFIVLSYAPWVSGALNIDAAERVRKSLEEFNLLPPSDIAPSLQAGSITPPPQG